MGARNSVFITSAILAALALAACSSNPRQRTPAVTPMDASASIAAPADPAEPATVAQTAIPGNSAAIVPATDCPPQEDGRGSPAALKAKATSICFAGGKTAANAEDRQLLRRHAELLKQNRRLVVTLAAFTDHRGSPNYNLAVTGKWLRGVADALADLGVPRHQIRKDAYPRREDRACTGACPPEVPRVELRYRK